MQHRLTLLNDTIECVSVRRIFANACKNLHMSDPKQSSLTYRKIYVDSRGRRFVKPRELFQDPDIQEGLKKADALAIRLGLKIEEKVSTR